MKSIIVGVTLLALSTFSFAALTAVDLDGDWSNGHEGVYDDVLNVTWLADANLAASNTFGVSGISTSGTMNWNTAKAFVAAMNADGGTGYLGVNTWRQSSVAPEDGIAFDMSISLTYDGSSDRGFQLSAPVDAAYNPNGQSPGFTGSELAYHYYNNFGAIGFCYGAGTSVSWCHVPSIYGIDDAPDPDGNKALFSNIISRAYWSGTELDSSSAFGFDFESGYHDAFFGGDDVFVWAVAPGNVGTVIPAPAAVWLFGAALIGLAGFARRR